MCGKVEENPTLHIIEVTHKYGREKQDSDTKVSHNCFTEVS